MPAMIRKRLLIHTAFLFVLPILVAWFGLGVLTTIAVVLLVLLWRWLIVLSGIVRPENVPDIVLETIPASHYVEKVRWSMDRLGIDYVERTHGGTLGAYFTGRSVPQLRVRTYIVQSIIGNSAEILRYLWGNYAATLGKEAAFLEPTAERLELEQRLDRYGRFLQVWVYHHILHDRELTLHLWGAHDANIPGWQKLALRTLFPLLRALIRKSFRLTDEHYAKAVHFIDDVLGDVDTRLSDGRLSILGGEAVNYTDITFAALSGLWLRPKGYGGGMADDCHIERDEAPAGMRKDTERWVEDYPKATAFIERMYADERF
jgi:glutathione S-transferase